MQHTDRRGNLAPDVPVLVEEPGRGPTRGEHRQGIRQLGHFRGGAGHPHLGEQAISAGSRSGSEREADHPISPVVPAVLYRGNGSAAMTDTTPSGQEGLPYWDPLDESLKADPHPVWRRLRDEAPVYRNEKYDFWALSRFEDVERAHR